ncbi:MAG: bifunctional phosphopantothenoylcysteine decarboxylase/phosphopantothenate--cysteine ligase CoaBC [Flavobacteriales bacterium]|nr:bifunctional phosphopantothenoylcysteine decarboxylase/phosphopantothenate--cysteine ligase CoaBC [Flavobacteriales bacterium]MBT4882301.1 bifunctional phosphopantothenoylcysteine decarboxylase/phosphopantothenate--cysteine ligase CoaBC [Flavobacteriales bacterium]MDG1349350.1 bifunctional phosphopantothenoylcysteine decarboxylase/phosphopantothenate--cysteine ligase CoaBC [Flavobacteriales bacterium]
MKMLKGKKVLLGITASIAAYKSAELVRLFKKAGASVRVIQTEASLDFVASLTLATLSENPVLTKMVDADSGEWSNHVELGLWADMMVIAPLTANTMAKMKSGECDNLLLATYLSAKCPVYFAPAMDLDMYKHPSTKANITTLEEYGNILIPSGFGELASGLVGEGRMAEPAEIIELITAELNKDLPLTNKRVLITAGPTHEPIDPVRFIGNRSSGKMGIALALEAANQGAKVDLVLGPTSLEYKHANITTYKIETAEQMYNQVDALFSDSDISIFAAAVADYSPEVVAENKIKKSGLDLSISLSKTTDILAEMGVRKKDKQFVVGFALETENELENAKSKLSRKKLDMIVLNSLNNKGAGFQHNTNKITIIDKANNITDFELKDKNEVAKDIINKIIKLS